jgi:hypothetical protein
VELSPPLPSDNWLIKDRVIDKNLNLDIRQLENLRTDERDDRWLSQVEIVTRWTIIVSFDLILFKFIGFYSAPAFSSC